MSHRAKRGPQALTSDRRQARPMAQRGAHPPAGAAPAARTASRGQAGSRFAQHSPQRPARLLVETEPQVAAILRTLAHVTRPLRRSDERALRLRHAVAPELRSALQLDSVEDAEALLDLDLAWWRYASPEDTADVAALVPPDVHDLLDRLPALKTPRWKRLSLPPPHTGR